MIQSRRLYGILGLVAALTVAGIASPPVRKAAGNVMQVFVTNTTSNPVPTTVQGVAHVVGTVALSNDANNPLPVHEVSASVRTPVQFTNGLSFANSQDEAVSPDLYTVPAGKRLVVQSIIVSSFQVPTGQKIVEMALSQKFDDKFPVTLAYTGTDDGGYEHYVGNFSGTLYISAGKILRMYAQRSSTAGVCAASMTVAGYLEDAS